MPFFRLDTHLLPGGNCFLRGIWVHIRIDQCIDTCSKIRNPSSWLVHLFPGDTGGCSSYLPRVHVPLARVIYCSTIESYNISILLLTIIYLLTSKPELRTGAQFSFGKCRNPNSYSWVMDFNFKHFRLEITNFYYS